ncbi:MAG: hypothetical protein ABJZ55_02235 [Fuerstiella sp.]
MTENMTGYTVHTGASKKFVDGWDSIFADGKSAKQDKKQDKKKAVKASGSKKKTAKKKAKKKKK